MAEDRQPEKVEFRAQLAQRQSSLMMSGQGDRLLIELESFGMDAVIALIGMTKFTKRTFKVTVEEISEKTLTEFDGKGQGTGEAEEGAARNIITVGRGGSTVRRDKPESGRV